MRKLSVALLGLFSTLSFADVTTVLDEDGVPSSLSQIGKIPTYNYSIPASKMFELLNKDIEEKRVHLSSTHGSYLDKFIESTENIQNGIQSSKNAFAANAGGKICITVINVRVPASAVVSPVTTQGTSTYSSRNCAYPDNVNFGYSQYLRSTISSTAIGVAGGLATLYAGNGVKNVYNPSDNRQTYGSRGAAFAPSSYGMAQEKWGVTFFNTWGLPATAQEIVLVVADWQL
ncbi:MAG: hypothetical protein WC091_15935 [Sulfuricellaceae bacterium]